jgi:hypothetical protein
MARYDTFQYSQWVYGGGRRLTRSTLLATVVNYLTIDVNISTPTETGKTYYLVRTYNGTAEHPMAGLIVSTGTITATEYTITDGVSNYADSITYNDVALTLLHAVHRGRIWDLVEGGGDLCPAAVRPWHEDVSPQRTPGGVHLS